MTYKEYKRNIKNSSAFNKVLPEKYLKMQKYLNRFSDIEKTPEGYMKRGKCLFYPDGSTITINSKITDTLADKFDMGFTESKIFITEFMNDIFGTSYLVNYSIELLSYK
jgi:hypothetical protein